MGIIDAGDYQDAGEDLGRAAVDFPRDESEPGQAGFRLPLPDDDVAMIVEAGDEVDFGRASADIPRDNSGTGRAGFRLPLPEEADTDAVVVEAGGPVEGRLLIA